MQNSPKLGVLIIRVSDPRQEREGLSLDNQQEVLRSYAEERGIRIVKEFRFQETADLKIRTRFRELISFVRTHKSVGCIVGYRVDRMTRNYHDHVLLDELRLNEGKELHFVYDRLVIEMGTVGREIQEWDTKVYLAKMYLNRLKEDAIISSRFKVSRGEWPGKAPFGYRNVKVNHRSAVVPDEQKAEIVRSCFNWYESGTCSMEQVRAHVYAQYGQKISQGQLDTILKNPFYYGEMLYRGELYPHIYEPLIKHTTYEHVSMIKESFHKKPYKYAGLDFLYRGLIRCADCGCSLTPERKRKKEGREYVYYHCTEYYGKHEAKWLTESEITAQLQHAFATITIPADEADRMIKAIGESHQSKVEYATEARTAIQDERRRHDRRLKVLLDDRLDGLITKERYIAKLEETEAEIVRLSRKEQDIDEADAEYYQTCAYLLELCKNAGEAFRNGTTEERRILVKVALQNCQLKEKTLVWELNKPFDTVSSHIVSQEWLPLLDMFRHKLLELPANLPSFVERTTENIKSSTLAA